MEYNRALACALCVSVTQRMVIPRPSSLSPSLSLDSLNLCMFTLGSFRFDAMLTLPILHLQEEEEKYFFEQKKRENKISYGSICFACRSTLGTIGNQRWSILSRAVVKIIKKKM